MKATYLLLVLMLWQNPSEKLNAHAHVAQGAASQVQQRGGKPWVDNNGIGCLPANGCVPPSSRAHAIDWKDCAEVAKQWQPEVERYNANHVKDGLRIQLDCTYSNPAPRKNPRKIALTLQEAARLDALRRESARIFSAESRYEEQLIKKHGIEKPDYGDPCWHFVGIIVGENAITVDQDAALPGCGGGGL